jgi:hypothetical protein
MPRDDLGGSDDLDSERFAQGQQVFVIQGH